MDRKVAYLLALAVLAGFAPTAGAGLIGWWQLDEGTGATAKDSSGNGNDGTLQSDPIWVEGQVGTALAFDDSRVSVPVSKSLTASHFQGPFTLTAWINPTRTGGEWQQVFRANRTGAATNNDTLFLNTDGRLSWRGLVGGAWAGGMCETAAGVVPANRWTHIALTGDKTNFRIYINAVLSQTSAWQTTDGANTTYWIGGDTYPDEFYSGMIDEVRIYDEALTLDQIKKICVTDAPSLARAQSPDPAHGALAVAMPLLQWKPGMDALLHSVYVGTSPELTEANLVSARQPALVYYYFKGLQPGTTYYWRVDEIEKDGVTVHTGDIWSFVAQALTAYHPDPADGSVDSSLTPALTWQPGQLALKHHVYFSDSSEAVTQGAASADKGEMTEPSFAPGTLESLSTYYWRVDETVAGGALKAGPVWKFTTCLPIDDFESYTDDLGSAIFDTWIDGVTNGLTGSTVGYGDVPFTEQTMVHGGKQSMPFDYNNTKEPYYSEAEVDLTPAQDWTANGAGALVLYVRGRMGNPPAPLYVMLGDASMHVATVVHPDPKIVRVTQWTQWKIPLSDFAGLNAAKVKWLCLGVGDHEATAAGGHGLIYIDDIRITKP